MQPLMKHALAAIPIVLMIHPIRLRLMQPLMIATVIVAIGLVMPNFGLILSIGLVQPSVQAV